MALQSSGAISIDDIRTEVGSTSGSLATLSAAVGFTPPHSISEFYGYASSTPNDLYWDFSEGGNGAKFIGNGGDSGPFSFSMWVKPSWAATDVNVQLFDINAGNGNNTDRLILIYDYGFNRLVFRYRAGSSNYHINWALNQNAASGNISRWHSGQTGPVNGAGFVHLAGTFDPTQSSALNGLKLYWNGVAFNTIIAQADGTRAPFPKTNMSINVAFNDAGDRAGDFDNVAFWFNRLLTSTEITSLYNAGDPITAGDAGLTTGLGFEATMESGAFIDETGNWQVDTIEGSASIYDSDDSASGSLYYWDLSNDIKWDSATTLPIPTSSSNLTVSLWIRPQWTATDLNLIIFDLTPSGTTSAANRFFLQYDYGTNRLVARYRSGGVNFDNQWALHENNSVTNTQSSNNYLNDPWTSSNRGNTNADGFINLILTYNGSQYGPTSAFKLYWNGLELTQSTAANSNPRSNITLDELTFCGNDHNTGGSRIADYMYMHMWDKLLTSSNVSSMYNSGTPISASDASLSTDLIFGDTSTSVPSANAADDSGNYDFLTANSQTLVQL